jgi:hypothetical protein
MKVGRMELHSDKAFGKILEHHHICEALIDLFDFSSIIPFCHSKHAGGFWYHRGSNSGTRRWTARDHV